MTAFCGMVAAMTKVMNERIEKIESFILHGRSLIVQVVMYLGGGTSKQRTMDRRLSDVIASGKVAA